MIGASRRVVLLADHTKVGNDHLARFADLDDIDVVITDSGVDPEYAERLRLAGPRVVVV
jgi:DeoR family transcriptional regulator, fructose operon transcriptional repressor